MNTLHAETRQYYVLHNTLVDIQKYLENEIETVDKVNEAVEQQG